MCKLMKRVSPSSLLIYSYLRSYYVHKVYCALDKYCITILRAHCIIMQVKSLHKHLIH